MKKSPKYQEIRALKIYNGKLSGRAKYFIDLFLISFHETE